MLFISTTTLTIIIVLSLFIFVVLAVAIGSNRNNHTTTNSIVSQTTKTSLKPLPYFPNLSDPQYYQHIRTLIDYIFDFDSDFKTEAFLNSKVDIITHYEYVTKFRVSKYKIPIDSFLYSDNYYVFLFHDNKTNDSKDIFFFCSQKARSIRKLPETSYLKTHDNYVVIFEKNKLNTEDLRLFYYICCRKATHKSYEYCTSLVALSSAFKNGYPNEVFSKDYCYETIYQLLSDSADFLLCQPVPSIANDLLYDSITKKIHNNELAMMLSKMKLDMYNSGYEKPRFHSEMDLFNLVSNVYGDAIFQFRSDWLEDQTLDIFIPSLDVAIEYQGQQHYQAVPNFGGERTYRANVQRDKKKRELCEINKIHLIEWKYDVEINLDNLNRLVTKR